MPKICGQGISVRIVFHKYGMQEFAFDKLSEAIKFANEVQAGWLPFPTVGNERAILNAHPAESVVVSARANSASVGSGSACPPPDYVRSATRAVGVNPIHQIGQKAMHKYAHTERFVPLSPWSIIEQGAAPASLGSSCGCW